MVLSIMETKIETKEKEALVCYNRISEVFELHKIDCQDAAKSAKYDHDQMWETFGESVEKMIEYEVMAFKSQGQDFNVSDFKIMPCLRM